MADHYSIEHCQSCLAHWRREMRRASTTEWKEVCQQRIDEWLDYLQQHYVEH